MCKYLKNNCKLLVKPAVQHSIGLIKHKVTNFLQGEGVAALKMVGKPELD